MQIICHGLKEEDFPVEFTDHKIFLGRDGSNSIAVAADGISRFHAVLLEEGEELFLQDNDSLNGTYLNYVPIHARKKLAHGDIIQIGYRLIRVDFQSDQKVVLDFVPPEQTEVAAGNGVPPVSSKPERAPAAGDDIERTMIASETLVSSSSSSSKVRFPGGTEIGKYVIIKRIGKGGMGEVYLARHKTLGISRALKVLLNESDDDGQAKFLDRFIREAKLASEIRHPNVVGVMDVETGSESGVPYIVMEYVDGGSLRNSLSVTKRLSEEQAVVIVEAVASALQAAEEHKIVHRDIKPDNIMFTRRGEVKLADLGIAKSSGNADLTRTNMMVGTPAYLPPEQAQNAKSVDARADIYSLGATFYEMLTGQPPYPGENTVEILHKLFLTPVPDPRKINPDISAASASIVMKMLAKDPKDRFQNADELLAMMERTYPPHTAHESEELVRKVIAGECEKNTAFRSGISSSTLSLWWLRMPNKWFVLSAASLFVACCIVGVLFLALGKRPAKSSASDDVPATMVAESHPDVSEKEKAPDKGNGLVPGKNTTDAGKTTPFGMPSRNQMALDLPTTPAQSADRPSDSSTSGTIKDPLVVTTNLDVMNPYDGVNSLHEALDYAQRHGTNATVSFAKDCEIRLSSLLAVYNGIIIDGSGHDVTLIGPKTEPMFHISNNNPSMTLKNISLISDYSGNRGGIMDVSSCPLTLESVKDGGTAERLWNISSPYDITLSGTSHLHRLRGTKDAAITIESGSVLEDADLDVGRNSSLKVFGILKNAVVKGTASICVYGGGTGENLTVQNGGFIETRAGGKINGLTVKYGAVCGYTKDAAFTGTFSIGGVTKSKSAAQMVGAKADLVFDLTERTEKKEFSFSQTTDLQDYSVLTGGGTPHTLIDNMESFLGARSYAIQVKEDQDPGSYRMAGIAENFKSRVSLMIGTERYSNVLSVGKSFSTKNRTYSLDTVEDTHAGTMLKLTIRKKTTSNTGQGQASGAGRQGAAGNNGKVVLEGIFDDKIEFVVRGDEIVCAGWLCNDPSGVTVNGSRWNDLHKPFKLGFAPDCSNARIAEKDGRDEITLTQHTEGGAPCAKLVINDYNGGASRYRVSISFEKEASDSEFYSYSDASDEGFYDYVSLPEETEKKKETPSASTKPREQEKLQGVLYLLTSEARSRVGVLFSSNKKTTCFDVLQKFVLGSWGVSTNSKGERYYPDLEQSFKRQKAPDLSCFYQQDVSWETGAELFGCRDTIRDAGWVAIYSGYVLAPFSGKFRFLGNCDDMMAVRFNKQIVLDYGCRSLTTGLPMSSDPGVVLHPLKQGDADAAQIAPSSDLRSLLSGNPTTREERDRINKSPLYSKNKLKFGPGDLAASPVLSVQKGQVIPIDILVGEQHNGSFSMTLLVERLDSNGKSIDGSSESVLLFHTSPDMPDHTQNPSFNQDSPIWKVVDSRGRPIQLGKTQK